jgi:clan AA aspartic protease
MITGTINGSLDAIIRLTVRGPTARTRRIRAVIDTGFNGTLTLPPALIADLELPWYRRAFAELGDGSETVFDVYRAVITWDRSRRTIRVDEADTMPLVGMELMQGFRLTMDVVRHGMMTIKPLRRRPRR